MAVVASVVFALGIAGQEHGGRQGRAPQSFTERYGQQLNLTDAQKTQIDGLEKKWQQDNADFLASFQKTMTEYREARQANDTAKIQALQPKVDSQRAEMTKLRGALEEKIAATFTDDQKAEWQKIKDERDARMKAREQSQ